MKDQPIMRLSSQGLSQHGSEHGPRLGSYDQVPQVRRRPADADQLHGTVVHRHTGIGEPLSEVRELAAAQLALHGGHDIERPAKVAIAPGQHRPLPVGQQRPVPQHNADGVRRGLAVVRRRLDHDGRVGRDLAVRRRAGVQRLQADLVHVSVRARRRVARVSDGLRPDTLAAVPGGEERGGDKGRRRKDEDGLSSVVHGSVLAFVFLGGMETVQQCKYNHNEKSGRLL